MVGKSKWYLFEITGRQYALDIMEVLFEKPKRFSELTSACPIEKTRSKRLRELEEANLVEAESQKVKKRNFIFYKLTKSGEKLIKYLINFKLE